MESHHMAMAQRQSEERRIRSPSPPPWSPITPTFSALPLAAAMLNQPVNLPPNIPIPESTNTDMIALRAALVLLQMQRVQSIENIQTLDRQRSTALAYPDEFRQGLLNGTIRSQHEARSIFDEEDYRQDDHQAESIQTGERLIASPLEGFGDLPAAINVVRCPPVNWAKYHIAGHILDQLHEQQRRIPEAGQISQSLPSRPHTIAAPYSPWHDQISRV